MATFSGKDGLVKIGGNAIAEITSWTMTVTSNNPSHASSSTGGGKTRNAGVEDFSGSIDYKIDATDPQSAEASSAFRPGGKVTLELYLNAIDFFSAPSILDDQTWGEVDVDEGETVPGSATFSRTGTLVYPSGGTAY